MSRILPPLFNGIMLGMQTLRETIVAAQNERRAVGHFNISDSNQLRALAEASQETGMPVIVGLSEGERDYFPLSHARALISEYQKSGVQLFLNADHTYTFEKVKEAIDVGVDSVVVDGAKLPFEENVALVKQCVAYARASGRDVLVEGELGYIGSSSSVRDALPEGVTEANLTTVEDAVRFVTETGVDCFAPAVGNVHGMLKDAAEPRLHPDRVRAIREAVHIPLVLHGASGNSAEDVHAVIQNGIAVVHINTELRVAYRDGLVDSFAKDAKEVAPYRFLAPALQAMRALVVEKLSLFNRKA